MANKKIDRFIPDELQMLIDETPHCDSIRPKNIKPTMVYQDVEQLKSYYPEEADPYCQQANKHVKLYYEEIIKEQPNDKN